jgi:uncharacterized membrane protein YphA (DoxX/SURF4 family)
MLQKLVSHYYRLQAMTIDRLSVIDGLAPLAFRVYLFNIFWMAGNSKWNPFDSGSSLENTIGWFKNSLDLPFPELMAYMAWATEYFGAILLLLGLATRWISIPLITTMIVAIFTVHIDNGWNAIASGADAEISSRVSAANSLLQEYGNYSWLTAKGSFVILQNGIEFAVTYLIMLLSLLFTGGGRYLSLDFYLNKFFKPAESIS